MGSRFAPVVVHLFGDVCSTVVDGVSLHAHHLGFDDAGTVAAMGALDGFAGRVVDLAGVGAIDDDGRNAVAQVRESARSSGRY